MRKKILLDMLRDSEERIRQLETIICPAESHEWRKYGDNTRVLDGYGSTCTTNYYICLKCLKKKTLDSFG